MSIVGQTPLIAGRWAGTLLVAGALAAALGVLALPGQGFAALLIAAVFGVTIVLGAIILLAVNGVVDARWYRAIAAAPIHLGATLPVPVVALVAVLLLGQTALYPWARPDVVAASHLLQDKAVWLNGPFFLARGVLVLIVWFALIGALKARVQQAIQSGGWSRLRGVCAVFLVALAPTLSIASWDWTMSLEPEWFSTMWAVYAFAGAFPAGIAAVALWTLWLDSKGRGDLAGPLGALTASGQAGVRHDLGKLLFAFSAFWAYIWFCQYMLIWYANIPEEATWFAHRATGGWAVLFWLNPIVNWVVPFVALLSAKAKRDPAILAQVSLVVLAGHWLDVYLMVGPALGPPAGIPVFALAATVAVVAGMWMVLLRQVGQAHPGRPRPALVR